MRTIRNVKAQDSATKTTTWMYKYNYFFRGFTDKINSQLWQSTRVLITTRFRLNPSQLATRFRLNPSQFARLVPGETLHYSVKVDRVKSEVRSGQLNSRSWSQETQLSSISIISILLHFVKLIPMQFTQASFMCTPVHKKTTYKAGHRGRQQAT